MKTFVGVRRLNGLVLEPFSLTLLILPSDAQKEVTASAKAWFVKH